MLARFQFLDMTAKLGLAKYYDKNDPGSTPIAAITRMLQEHVYPLANWHDGQEWRWKRLYNEPCDVVFKHNKSELDDIYPRFSGAENGLGEAKRMCIKEWISLMDAGKICDDTFTVREARLCFLRGQQVEMDEQTTDDHRKSGVVEWYEALARVADMKDLTQWDEAVRVSNEGLAEGEEPAPRLAEPAPGGGDLAPRVAMVVKAIISALCVKKDELIPRPSTAKSRPGTAAAAGEQRGAGSK
jgi:hypothetical protein